MASLPSKTQVLECDVAIVGGTTSAWIAADKFAQAGFRVLVLDQSPSEGPSSTILTTVDNAISICSSDDAGGVLRHESSGMIVDPIPYATRMEWVKTYGLLDFDGGGAYESALERIVGQLGDGDHTTSSSAMAVTEIAEGGSLSRARSRNLFRYSASDHGATVVKCRVNRICTAPDLSGAKACRATGLECYVENKQVATILAEKCIVLCCGALETPCLLLRSGFQNRHIGKHLLLRPSVGALGIFRQAEEETSPVESMWGQPMESSLQAFQVEISKRGSAVDYDVLTDEDVAGRLPWVGARYPSRNRMFLTISVQDSAEGIVTPYPSGSCSVQYTLSDHDRSSLALGLRGALSAFCTEDMEEIVSGAPTSIEEPYALLRQAFPTATQLEKDLVQKIGCFSPEQVGSCRMSDSNQTGAVDGNGELWECTSLFVMDASTFPSSVSHSMLASLAVAYVLSERQCARIRKPSQMLDLASIKPRSLSLYAGTTVIQVLKRVTIAILRLALLGIVLAPLLSAWFWGVPEWLANYENT